MRLGDEMRMRHGLLVFMLYRGKFEKNVFLLQS